MAQHKEEQDRGSGGKVRHLKLVKSSPLDDPPDGAPLAKGLAKKSQGKHAADGEQDGKAKNKYYKPKHSKPKKKGR